jgi:hypothetical protein
LPPKHSGMDGKLRPNQDWTLEVADESRRPLFQIHIRTKKLNKVASVGGLSTSCSQRRRRTETPDESRHTDLVASDFPKSIPPLYTLGEPMCSIQQIGKHRDDLSHPAYLRYFNWAVDQVISS